MSFRRSVLAGAVAFAAVVGSAQPTGAQSFEGPGARAQGMGGAFVAVADDASATWWNPAGLASGPFFNLLLERHVRTRKPEGGPAPDHPALDQSITGFSLGTPPLGFSYYRTRYTFVPAAAERNGRDTRRAGDFRAASLVTHQTGLTLLQSITSGIAVGSTVKFVRGIAATAPTGEGTTEDPDRLLNEAANLVGRATNRLDADVGLHVARGPIRAGLVVRNLARPSFTSTDGEELQLERQARLGFAWLTGATTVAADLDLTRGERSYEAEGRRLAVGVEQRLRKRAAVRGGYRVNLSDGDEGSFSLGASAAVRPGMWLDGFWSRGGLNENRWGLAARVAY